MRLDRGSVSWSDRWWPHFQRSSYRKKTKPPTIKKNKKPKTKDIFTYLALTFVMYEGPSPPLVSFAECAHPESSLTLYLPKMRDTEELLVYGLVGIYSVLWNGEERVPLVSLVSTLCRVINHCRIILRISLSTNCDSRLSPQVHTTLHSSPSRPSILHRSLRCCPATLVIPSVPVLLPWVWPAWPTWPAIRGWRMPDLPGVRGL